MLRVELKSDEAFAALDRLAGALGDMSPVMSEIGEQLMATTEAHTPSASTARGIPILTLIPASVRAPPPSASTRAANTRGSCRRFRARW